MFGNNYGGFNGMGGYGFNNPMYYGQMMGVPRAMNYGSMAGGIGRTGLGNGITSLFSGIKKINWGGMLAGTQKTLNIVNQAIPLFNQVRPMYNNMKTMFRVFNAVKSEDDKKADHEVNKVYQETKKEETRGPSFFL